MNNATLTRGARFVERTLRRCARDKGFAARLCRADNLDTEYQSLGDLASLGVNVEWDEDRLPHALVGAALARLKTAGDGWAGLGTALRHCFDEQDQGEVRLRRLLACDRLDELCAVLRPLLRLMADKSRTPLRHADLLDELLRFPTEGQRVKLRWARNFYGAPAPEEEGDEAEA